MTFTLAVNEFKSAFNSSTGNFDITVTFIGYMYGLYTDIPFNCLLVAPYYSEGGVSNTSTCNYWNERKNSGEFTYADEDGKSNAGGIYTFIELMEQYGQLSNNLKNETNSKHIVKIIQLTEQMKGFLQNGK